MRRKGQRPALWSLPARGVAAFCGSYIGSGGWRDGAAGFVIAVARVLDSTLPRALLLFDDEA
jgi:predicted NAD/FAD-binding protein